MVRYKVLDAGFRWARVESWTRDDFTIVRETRNRVPWLVSGRRGQPSAIRGSVART
jgi:hypothetical protein